MKKHLRKIALLVFTTCGASLQAEAQQLDWAVSYGGGGSDIQAMTLALDGRSNVYNAGYFYSNPDVDPGAGSFTLSSKGFSDAFIQKLDPSGHFLWAKQLGSLHEEGFTICETDADDNVYLAGYFNDTLDFDPGPFVHYAFGTKESNMFVLKLDPNGDFVWVYTLSAGNGSSIRDIEVNTNGIYLGGNFTDTLYTRDTLVSNGSSDGFVMKLDHTGTPQWEHLFGGVQGDYLQEIESDASGHLFMMGVFQEMVDIDFGPGIFSVAAAVDDRALFILKTDAEGNFLHGTSYQTDSYPGYSALEIDHAGHVIMTLNFFSTIDFDNGPGYYNVHGDNDIFVLKLSNTCEFEWVKVLKGTGQLYVFDIAIDDNDNIYLAGEHNNSADYDPGPDTLSSPGFSWIYVSFLEKLDRNGNFVWVETEETNHRYAEVCAVSNGEIYANGVFRGTIDADPSYEEYMLTGGVSSANVFVFKWSDPSVGIKENGTSFSYSLYPNPTSGNITLDLGNVSGTSDVVVSDLTGKVVSKQTFAAAGKVSMNIDGPAGIYFVSVSNTGSSITKKLVKQ